MKSSNFFPSGDLEKCFVIMGAGPSGLAAAWKLTLEQESIPVIVVEKSDRVGGLSASFRWHDSKVDFGPHRLSPAIPEVVNFVKELLGPELLEIKAKHMVRLDGTLFQFPPRLIDFLNYRLMKLGSKSAISFLGMKLFKFKNRFDSRDFESVLNRKFGRYFSSRVIIPMARKVWPGHSESLDPRFIDLRFKVISLFELIRSVFKLRENLNPKIAYYPNQGYGQIFDEMLKVLSSRSNFHLFLNAEVKSLTIDEVKKSILSVNIETKNQDTFDSIQIKSNQLDLISSIPLNAITQLIESAYQKQTKVIKRHRLEIVSLRLFLFLYNQEKTLQARTYIFPQHDVIVNRMFEQNLYSRATVPEGKSLVVADLSFPFEEITQGNRKKSVPDALAVYEQLTAFGILPREGLIESGVVDVPFAYLRPSLSNAVEIFRMKKEIYKFKNIYLLGRFGAGVYNNADFAILSGFDVARKLLSGEKKHLNDDESWNNHHNVFG